MIKAEEKETRCMESFTAWGTFVEGRRGRAGAPLDRRISLARLLCSVAQSSTCDRKTLERLIGGTIHPLIHRRELMRVWGVRHRFLHDMKYGVATVLPNAVREELGAAALVLIAAHASLRWELSGEVSATDATLAWRVLLEHGLQLRW